MLQTDKKDCQTERLHDDVTWVTCSGDVTVVSDEIDDDVTDR